jgi:hypothetical protein
MATGPQLPDMQLSPWLRNMALRNGVFTGVLLSCIFVAWLVVANRVKELESYAEARNLVAGAILVSILAIPVLRFLREPARLFVAGLTAWTLLTATYLVSQLFFRLLESRMGALHVFMLGAVSYGFVAVLNWVFWMCAGVRDQHLAQSRQTAATADRHRTL